MLSLFSTWLFACGGSQENTAEESTAETEMPAETAEPAPMASLEQQWATDTTLRTPESVLYHPEQNVLFVSNINGVNPQGADGDGFISKVSTEGQVTELKWVDGLNDPKGMGMLNGMLYVTDINEVVEIDMATGEIPNRYPVEGAKFLNDITTDTQAGVVYISDSNAHRLHKLQNGELTTIKEDSAMLQRPNGLLMDDSRLLMLSMAGEKLYEVNPETMEMNQLSGGFPGADGIVKTALGNYLISNWNGEVYYYTPAGEKTRLLNTKDEKINAADIDYAAAKDMLFVPTFYDNRVVAYQLQENAM